MLAVSHEVIQWVKVDVGQKRAYDAALRRAFFPVLGLDLAHLVHDSLLEEAFDQLEHSAIGNVLTHQAHQALMRDAVEIALDVHIHHVSQAAFQQLVHAAECVFATTSGSAEQQRDRQHKVLPVGRARASQNP